MPEKRGSKCYKWYKKATERFPLNIFVVSIVLWGILVFLYRVILFPLKVNIPLPIDIPKWFPISVFYGPSFHLSGLPYLVIMVLGLVFLVWKFEDIKEFYFIAGCCLLIVLGNLGQGGFDKAFLDPFIASDAQYYYNAVRVDNWMEWLKTFNENQISLSIHSMTHPPFAVLIHNVFLAIPIAGHRLAVLALSFSIISLSSLFIFSVILKLYQLDVQKRKLIILLFAVLPAMNIYSIVCLDGVILATSTLFLLGLALIIHKPEQQFIGYLAMVLGFILTNLLTYGGLFLLGLGILMAMAEYSNRKTTIVKGNLLCLVLFCIVLVFLKFNFQYDHVQGFVTASKIENPNGFRLFSDPLNYLLTRFEGVSEIALFLSFSVLAFFIRDRLLRIPKGELVVKNANLMTFIGTVVLAMMFFVGTFRTGETARTCLFIYPYLLLALIHYDIDTLKKMILLAGTQTALMQLFVSYYW